MGKQSLILVSLLLFLSGCTFMHQDFDKYGKNYEKVPLHLLTLGDTKEQVVKTMDQPVNVIGSKKFEKGIVEVWAYEKWHAAFGADDLEEEYWLYFLNGKLEQWGRAGDWSKEADRIYEIRYR